MLDQYLENVKAFCEERDKGERLNDDGASYVEEGNELDNDGGNVSLRFEDQGVDIRLNSGPAETEESGAAAASVEMPIKEKRGDSFWNPVWIY